MAVPGSSDKMLKKAQGFSSDQVFLDLEDAVAPVAKPAARTAVVQALNHGDWSGKTRVVRVNDADTEWAHEDVLQVVRGAGANLDCIMLPKVERVAHIHWLDVLLTQIERELGLPVGGIGIEAQIEGPAGLSEIDAIAAATSRTEALIFGPGDFMAAMKMPALTIGAPGASGFDPFDTVLMTIAMTARKYGLQAIDGPFALIRDLDGYRASAERAAAYGYDGKWVLHPGQIDTANDVFAPTQAIYDKAEMIIDAYDYYSSAAGGGLGAVMLGDEMIDEASRKLALVTAERGRLIDMPRTTRFDPPNS
ncbi:CoA ester lyase [Antrihabitans sp. YC2-6]|uniref:HpcH/HpaI aldolase/citrate lyase family protein n=1 Tax=Antrihabitans sp. YC2-6 TaxID=2799498 RepID=UPI0018F68040|nr:CoA ester lyase [Antrihabitans sp. YC2-6]MBJ8346946.1 CoA ester lyase [Antrihabitans sp. YC2-6]